MCPIETPEGPNIGLISSLATYARVNPYGFIETPYRRVKEGRVTRTIEYLTADDEEKHTIAQANAKINQDGKLTESRVTARRGSAIVLAPPDKIDYMDVSPKQIVSVATALIPFLEHDDSNRALMGSNMQRQAVPLLKPEAPLLGTGMEYRAAIDSGAAGAAGGAGGGLRGSADGWGRGGARVLGGEVGVREGTPHGDTDVTAEGRLLRGIVVGKARAVRGAWVKVPQGEKGEVVALRVCAREAGDELSPGVNQL